MKLQFAIIEALSSLILALSAISLTTAIMNNYQHYYAIEYGNISKAAAAYDFLMQTDYNSMSENCFKYSIYGKCSHNYTRDYEIIYGINKIGIIQNGSNNYSKVYCTNSSGPKFMCVGVS